MDKVSDNYFTDFPSRMSDGRFMTDYSPNCEMNLKMQNDLTSWQYRYMLMNDSNNIMNNSQVLNESMYGCQKCVSNEIPKARYVQKCDHTGCKLSETEKFGIGLQ